MNENWTLELLQASLDEKGDYFMDHVPVVMLRQLFQHNYAVAEQCKKDREAAIVERNKVCAYVDTLIVQAKEMEAQVAAANRLNGELKKAFDTVALDLGSSVNERDALKKFIEGVREKAAGLLHSNVYERALGLTDAGPEHGKAIEKRKCGLAKPLGSGERCVLEFGHVEPCDHKK